jgi:transposase InsO family protein
LFKISNDITEERGPLMLVSYQKAFEKLRLQLKGSRDRDLRIKANLILLACKLQNVQEACERRGFSKKFFYKWYGRLIRGGWKIASLAERSRRPKTRHPHKISRRIEDSIWRLHAKGYGAPSLRAHLSREGITVSISTISHVLRGRRKKALWRSRKQKLKAHRRRYEIPIPGHRIQIDVKYVPELIEGLRVYNYVAVDECTRLRYIFPYTDLTPRNTVDFLNKIKAFFPFSLRTIQTDNGFEFTNRLIPTHQGHEHPMDEWCRLSGIRHRCIPPGEKELNGKVERSHRIDEQFFYWQAHYQSFEAFEANVRAWVKVYNHERLHGGIGFTTPYEKLLERFQNLRSTPQEEEYEFTRLNFLKDLPKRLSAYKRSQGFDDNPVRWAA